MEKGRTKVVALVGLLLMLLSSCACEHKNTEKLPGVIATCEEWGKTAGWKCSDCGEILTAQEDVEPLGHTTEKGICSRCGKNFSNWEILEYKDKFGDPTGEKFVGPINDIYGTFSNSATTNSKLEVYFRIDKDSISFILWEYGSHQVKNSYSRYKEYKITMKISESEKLYVPAEISSGSGILHISNDEFRTRKENVERVRTALFQNDSITFLIEEEDSPTTSYKFTIDTTGLEEIYKLLK